MFAIYYLLKALLSKAVRFFDVTLVALMVISSAALPLHYSDIALCKQLEIAQFVEYLPFFLFGLLCGRYREKYLALLRNDYARAGLILSFIVLGFLRFNGVLNEDSAIYKVIDYYLIRWNAVVVLFMIFDSVRDYFQQPTSISRSLQFVGRRTLDIYLIHYFFLPDLTSWGLRFAGNANPLLELLFGSLIALCVLGITLVISFVL